MNDTFETMAYVVKKTAWRYKGALSFEDASQEAWAAVLGAEKKFDPGHGGSLYNYLYTAAKYALFEAKRKNTNVPIPRRSDATTSVFSLNTPRWSEDGQKETYMEVLVEEFDDEAFIQDKELWDKIGPRLPKFARTLSEPMAHVFRLRFIEGRGRKETSLATGFTRVGHMEHIEAHLLGLLRDFLVEHKCIDL